MRQRRDRRQEAGGSELGEQGRDVGVPVGVGEFKHLPDRPVNVQVYESGRDMVARRVDHFCPARTPKVGPDLGYLVLSDKNVALEQDGVGEDHGSVLEENVSLCHPCSPSVTGI